LPELSWWSDTIRDDEDVIGGSTSNWAVGGSIERAKFGPTAVTIEVHFRRTATIQSNERTHLNLVNAGKCKENWRRGSESNRRIKVLQTSPLPLGYRARGKRAESKALRLMQGLDNTVSTILMERETGFEPATSTLARSHSTTELLPLSRLIINSALVLSNGPAEGRPAPSARTSARETARNLSRSRSRNCPETHPSGRRKRAVSSGRGSRFAACARWLWR
jgi:hypothetical protein